MAQALAGGDFAGRVAVVTGGAGGIGGAIADALTERGAEVAVLDVRTRPEAAVSPPCDVRDADAVSRAVSAVSGELGTISLLVCAAGVVSECPLAAMDPAEWRRVVEISLHGTFHALRAVLPAMVRHGEGSVVAFSSGWAAKGYPNGSHYAAAKAGVEALVKSAALETARSGVRVNAVAPGPIETGMLAGLPGYGSRREARAAAIPMGRIGRVGDVVEPVLFLLGDGSRYVTGQIMHVNGGLLMP